MRSVRTRLVTMTLMAGWAATALAGPPTFVQYIGDPNPLGSDGYGQGQGIAIDGDVAVIGAMLDDTAGMDRGAAYIFRKIGGSWVQQIKIISPFTSLNWFGYSVAVRGDVVVIGHPGSAAVAPGRAYVYRYNGTAWVQEQVLTAADPSNNQFGYDVVVGPDMIAVGAPSTPGGGAVYIFTFNGSSWVQQAKLTKPSGNSFFGAALALSPSEDLLLVGAPDGGPSGWNGAGRAHLYRFNGTTWLLEATLVASDAADADFFGTNVALSDDVALIGAYGDDPLGSWSGSAYVFRYNGSSWPQQAKLIPADGQANDAFGISVALQGELALVGTREDDDAGNNIGAVYTYRYSASWFQTSKLLGASGTNYAHFGKNMAIDGENLLIGSGPDNGRGPVYLYSAPTVPIITDQPDDAATVPGATVQFSVAATGKAPLNYSWRRNGVLLVDGPTGNGSTISGANNTPTLTLTNVQVTDAGTYDIVIDNDWGSVDSDDAALGVAELFALGRPELAAADRNRDGIIDLSDLP